MPNTNTPSDRVTRSGSSPKPGGIGLTLADIKDLIEKSTKQLLTSLRGEVDGLKSMMSKLLERVDEIEKQSGLLQDRCKTLEHDQANLLFEMEERDRRKPNLIVSGIPEKADGSVNDRKQWDMEQVEALFGNLVDLNENVVKAIYRIGNTNSAKPRLLKVVCRDVYTKRDLLSKAKNLRSEPKYQNVYLNTDLTQLQQKENKKLREELQRRRNAGEDVVIRYGKVVSRKNFQ